MEKGIAFARRYGTNFCTNVEVRWIKECLFYQSIFLTIFFTKPKQTSQVPVLPAHKTDDRICQNISQTDNIIFQTYTTSTKYPKRHSFTVNKKTLSRRMNHEKCLATKTAKRCCRAKTQNHSTVGTGSQLHFQTEHT